MKRFGRIITILVLGIVIAVSAIVTGCGKGSKVLKIVGIIAPGIPGEGQRKGIELAVEEVNAAGGILGKTVRVSWVTEGRDAAKLKNDIIQAIERDGCTMMVGGFSSAAVFVAMSVMKDKKVLWFGTGGAHTSIIRAVEKDPGM